MVYLKRDDKMRRAPAARGAAVREAHLDEVFFALSHPVRRRLLERLGELGDQSVAPLAQPFDDSPAQITKHLAILERAGLITREIAGREHRLHLEPHGIGPALDWVARHRAFWGGSVDRLEQLLDSHEDDAR